MKWTCVFSNSVSTLDADLVARLTHGEAIKAYCPGRTMLEKSNVWLSGVPAIAKMFDYVKHAMLYVSAGYVLDYAPSENLKQRASVHHNRAAMLLGLELNKAAN